MHTVSELSETLKVSEAFIYARLADGSLKHFRLGNGQGGIRISDEQLAEFLESRERGGQPAPHTPKVKEAELKHVKARGHCS